MRIRLTCLPWMAPFALLLCCAPSGRAATIVSTLAGGTFVGSPSGTIGTFTYTIPAGQVITAANLSATSISADAAAQVFIEGLSVYTCASSCAAAPLSQSLSFSIFPDLADGNALLTYNNAVFDSIVISNPITLTLTTSQVPEPAAWLFVGAGVAALGLARIGRR